MDAASAIATFMNGADAADGATTDKRGLLDSLFGGGNDNSAGGAVKTQGIKTADGTSEAGVSKAAGTGASSGLPTCSDNGTISVTYHQVNQDGAGPLTADIDPTSGGTDPAAFQQAQVTQDVPGIALGLSTVATTDFPVKVQMPEGMTCSGTVGDVKNVCVARIRNNTPAGKYLSFHNLPSNHTLLTLLTRALWWICCLHPELCRKEARRRVQSPQASLCPRNPWQARRLNPCLILFEL